MQTGLAYQSEGRDELIGGRLVLMSPSPSIIHNKIVGNIFFLFKKYIRSSGKNKCDVFTDNVDVYLTDIDKYIPDCTVVCDPDKISFNGVHGAPDLVVEVLSPGTAKNDRGRKKDVYEMCGVREYWIVSPAERSVEQYFMDDGRFVLQDVYVLYYDYMTENMTEEEKADIATEFRCSLSDEPVFKLCDIFEGVM